MYFPPVEVAIQALGSVKRVAHVAGVSRRTVIRWRKTGQIPVDPLTKLLVPCSLQGITAEDLLHGRFT